MILPECALSDTVQYPIRCRRKLLRLLPVVLIATGSIMQADSAILWTDNIQSGASPWGFSGVGVEHPIGTTISPGDSNGANLSRVADPANGGGFAMRHFGTFDTDGSRSQAGIYGDVNTALGNQAKSPEGVWVAQEWYFPAAIGAGGDAYCWINLWDWHSVDANRGNRWHTSPGLMLARDGSMKVSWEWGGPAYSINPGSKMSTIAMPVGRWFDIEMHYAWSSTPTATITLWIDGQLALEQTGVQTRAASHQIVETYSKFYGSSQGRGPWVPTPSVRYTRNVRIANARIWQSTPVIAARTAPAPEKSIAIKLTNNRALVVSDIDKNAIRSIAAFSLDGRETGRWPGAALFSTNGRIMASPHRNPTGGMMIVRIRSDGAEETKMVPRDLR